MHGIFIFLEELQNGTGKQTNRKERQPKLRRIALGYLSYSLRVRLQKCAAKDLFHVPYFLLSQAVP